MDIVERLRFDAARCEAQFSKGVATNIKEAASEIERLRTEIPTPSSIRYALEHSGFVVSDGEIDRICRKLGIAHQQEASGEKK